MLQVNNEILLDVPFYLTKRRAVSTDREVITHIVDYAEIVSLMLTSVFPIKKQDTTRNWCIKLHNKRNYHSYHTTFVLSACSWHNRGLPIQLQLKNWYQIITIVEDR